MMYHFRRFLLTLTFCGLAIIVAGCNSIAATTTAATVYTTSISTDTYQQMSRLFYEFSLLQNPTQTFWQKPDGRVTLGQSQQIGLQALVNDALFKHKVAGLKLSKDELDKSNQTISDQVNQLFANPPSSLKSLIDRQILTRPLYTILVRQNANEQLIFAHVKVKIANISMLTVPDIQTAKTLQQQLQQDGTQWNNLAVDKSTDPAKDNGGQVAVMPRYILPPALDNAIFAGSTPDPNTVNLLQSPLGFTLLRVNSITDQSVLDLSSTSGLFVNAQLSQQGAAVQSYLYALEREAKPDVRVNWCNDPVGKPCGPVNNISVPIH